MSFIGKVCKKHPELLGKRYSSYIVPLKSKLVCGLHCEFNLQVIPVKENLIKNNRYWLNMPEGVC